jgi:large subunit ribosomal protein L23
MDAEKVSVRKAVESLYGVNVEGVRIVRLAGKPVRRGKRVTFRNDVKKALVTLKKGQTLSLYEGV